MKIELRGDKWDRSQSYIDIIGLNEHNVEIGAEHVFNKMKTELRGENLKLFEAQASIHKDDKDVSYYGRQVKNVPGHFGVVQPTNKTSQGKEVRINMPKLPISAVSGLVNDQLKDDIDALELNLKSDGRNGCVVDIRAKTAPMAQHGANYVRTYLSQKVPKTLAHRARNGTIITLGEGNPSSRNCL